MKRIFLGGLIIIFLGVFINGGLIVHAATVASNHVCSGISQAGGDCSASNGSSIDSLLAFVLNILSAIAGLISVIFIIIGGLKYITSGGNPEKTNQAKNTILYTVIGLLIIALAQVIVRFVLHKAYIL